MTSAEDTHHEYDKTETKGDHDDQGSENDAKNDEEVYQKKIN